MDMNELKKYINLYKSAKPLGSARILRDYLELDDDFPVPLSIPHGVDMNHCVTAMDIQSIEPIHWSCNQFVHERAVKVKPAVRLPHPWLMLKANRPLKPGAGVLVIGPPPGVSNDKALLDCLTNIRLSSFDILLKYRGDVDSSRSFWVSNNINVVSAGLPDDFFYDRLFDLLGKYEYVIGCTLSSALFFAASIGKKCKLIEDYTFSAYDGSSYLDQFDLSSSVARGFTRLLREQNYSETADMALDILGGAFLREPHILRAELGCAIDSLREPVYFGGSSSYIGRKMVLGISRLLGKTGLIRYGVWGYLRQKFMRKISIIKMNEIDMWVNGVNSRNFQVTEIRYIKNVTEPGWAVD